MMLPEPHEPVTPATRDELDSYAQRVRDAANTPHKIDAPAPQLKGVPVDLVSLRHAHDPETHRVTENGMLKWCLDCEWWVKA